jgi:hypothetical protein
MTFPQSLTASCNESNQLFGTLPNGTSESSSNISGLSPVFGDSAHIPLDDLAYLFPPYTQLDVTFDPNAYSSASSPPDSTSDSTPSSLPYLPSLNSSPTPPPVHELLQIQPLASHNTSTSSVEGTKAVKGSKGTSAGRPRAKFASEDMQAIAGVAIEVNPWMAKHGEKGNMWKKVAQMLWDRGKCRQHTDLTIRKKMDQLMAYHEVRVCIVLLSHLLTLPQNPNGPIGSQISSDLGETGRICIAALLDRAVYLRDGANKVAEENKEKVKKVCHALLV